MADRNNKVEGNANGVFYVDTACIGCGLCTESAPGNFKMNADGDLAMVFKQPVNADEETSCNDAKDACPADAIGDDGEL
jgi:ferredoxin